MRTPRFMQALLRSAGVACLTLAVAASVASAQCALCKEALRSDPETAQLAAGFEVASIFLWALLSGMTVAVVLLLVKTARKFTVLVPEAAPVAPAPAASDRTAPQTA